MKPRLVFTIAIAAFCVPTSSAQTHVLHAMPVPKYPPLAYVARIQGTVKLNVTIGAEGEVARADIVSGPSLLASYALENIETWKFEPWSQQQQDETVFEFVYKIEGKAIQEAPISELRARVVIDLPTIEISLPPMTINTDVRSQEPTIQVATSPTGAAQSV